MRARYALLALMLAVAVAAPWREARAQYAVQFDTPMNFAKKLSGDQPLNFSAGGYAVKPKGTKLSYRVITSQKEYKKVWGYLYDSTVAVDFSKYRVLAVYKQGAKGGFTIVPKRVYHFNGDLKMNLDVVWDGKPTRSNPFLFLAVEKFKNLEVEEFAVAPRGEKVRWP